MEVVALKPGFYDGARRRAGDKFEVADGAKASWFAPTSAPAAQKAEKAAKAAKEPKSEKPVPLSQVGKAPAQSFVQAMKPADGDGSGSDLA